MRIVIFFSFKLLFWNKINTFLLLVTVLQANAISLALETTIYKVVNFYNQALGFFYDFVLWW